MAEKAHAEHLLVRTLRAIVDSFDVEPAVKLEALREVGNDIPKDSLEAEFEAARLDALGTEEELRKLEGGGLSLSEFAKRLGVGSPETIRTYRNEGRIFAWEKDQRNFRYPAWQIHRGSLLPGLPETLAVLREKELSPYAIISFFVYPSDDLGGKSPLQLLRAKKVEEVLEHAKRHGDIGS